MWSLKRKCQFDEIFIDISVSVVDWASNVLCYKKMWMTRRMQKMALAAVVQTTARNPLMYMKYHDATFTLSLRHGQFVWVLLPIAGGVAGTPWYFVNGIDMALDPNLTYDIHSWSRFMQRTLRSPGRPQKDVRNSNGVYNPALGRAYFLLTTHITIGLLSISFHILCL